MKFLKPLALSLSTLAATALTTGCSDSDTDFKDFTKNSYSFLDATGTPTTDSAQAVCVLDSETNLVWEIKGNTSLSRSDYRARNKTYTWYDDTIGEGYPDQGSCGNALGQSDISCDTARYTQALQSDALCGLTGWRLPTRNELASILTCIAPNCNADDAPQVDQTFFFNTNSNNFYWAGDSLSESFDSNIPGIAGMASFLSGELSQAAKDTSAYIRAVSPAQ